MSLLVALALLPAPRAPAQGIVDQIGAGGGAAAPPAAAGETILRISNSQSIFILSNRESGLAKGDFVTLLVRDRPVARALVTMVRGERAGIKIHRIHSLARWGGLREGTEVRVLRGDGRAFVDGRGREGGAEAEEAPPLVPGSTEDLFDATALLDEGAGPEEDRRGVIEEGTVLAFSVDYPETSSAARGTERHFHPNVSLARQFEENLWIELGYSRGLVRGFPSDDINTLLDSVTLRIQYAVPMPLHTILQPYVGYQRTMADSPEAGQPPRGGDSVPSAQLLGELDDVDAMNRSRTVFGVTVLRRLVPSWFVKGVVGSDTLSLGLALGF